MTLADLPHKYQDQAAPQLYGKTKASNTPPHPVLEQGLGHGPLGEGHAQKADSAIYEIRVVSYRTRLCDEDNLCEKYHIDSLRYLKIIPDDSPDKCHIITTQKKVATKKEQRTDIFIERIS